MIEKALGRGTCRDCFLIQTRAAAERFRCWLLSIAVVAERNVDAVVSRSSQLTDDRQRAFT